MRVGLFLFNVALILALGLPGAGCKTTADSPAGADPAPPEMEDGIVATVRYIDLEGGFYGVESDAGENYYPINLTDEYKEDGLRIVFKVKPRPEIMTTVMWGQTVEIVEIVKM